MNEAMRRSIALMEERGCEYKNGLWQKGEEYFTILKDGTVERYHTKLEMDDKNIKEDIDEELEKKLIPCLKCGEDKVNCKCNGEIMKKRTQNDNIETALALGFQQSKSAGVYTVDGAVDGRPVKAYLDFRDKGKGADTTNGKTYGFYEDEEGDGKFVPKAKLDKLPHLVDYKKALTEPAQPEPKVEKPMQGVPQEPEVIEVKPEAKAPAMEEAVEEMDTQTTAIAPIEASNSGALVMDMPISVEEAGAMWDKYQELTKRILDDNDYQQIGDKKFKKKSAYRKYARFYGVNTQIVDKSIKRDGDGRVVEAEFTVRATMGSRFVEAWGSCSVNEDRFKGKPGRKSDHDIPATAETRATSRAISNIIGAGEVSAEECM